VPFVLFCWKSDDLSYSETCCQMVMTLILLPITIASTCMGFSSGASTQAAAELLGNTEGTLVASSTQLVGEEQAPSVGSSTQLAGQEQAPGAAARAPRSKAAKKRLKRAEFLERVRAKVEALRAALPATSDDNETPPTLFQVAGRQAAVAIGLIEPRRRTINLSFTKAAGASAGVVLQPHGRCDAQLMITRIARDSACHGVLKVGDMLIGVNRLGGAEAPLTGRLDDIEAVVAVLHGSTEVRVRVLR